MTTNGSRSEFRRDGGVVVASFFGLAFGVGAIGATYSIGVLIDPLQREFGWSRAQILTANSILAATVATMSLAVGWLADRTSVRRLIVASQVGFGLAYFGVGAFVHDLWSFYIGYFFIAVLGAATMAVPFAKLITARFNHARGLALGLAMSGTGFCGLVAPSYIAFVVERFGWREAYFAIGLLPLMIALPLTLLFVRDLRPTGGADLAEASRLAPPLQGGDLNLRAATKTFRFWTLFTIFVLGSCVMTALITGFVPILADKGYSTTEAAAVAGSFGLAVICGRVVVGFLIDFVWAPLVGFLLFLPAAAAIGLLSGDDLSTAAAVSVIFVTGFAAGAEVDLMGYLVSRYFGVRHFGKIFAGIYVGFALGPSLTTPLFGASRDQSGDYQLALAVAAVTLALAGALFLTLGRFPPVAHRGRGPQRVVRP